MNTEALRHAMVQNQIISRGVRDERVIAAMKHVPRHLFMPEEERYRAYEDNALPIGHGQTISQPYMVAIMTELLELSGSERILEIGTGSGYQAAVLAELAGHVFTIERIADLSRRAGQCLLDAGYTNVTLRTGDGSAGWPEEAPFDRIIVTAGTPAFPAPLVAQLGEGGIGVAPVGTMHGQQLLRIRKQHGKTSEQHFTPCVFVPLIGAHGWKE